MTHGRQTLRREHKECLTCKHKELNGDCAGNVVRQVQNCWAHDIREFENRILRRIFGPKRDENWEWRRLHNEELHSLYRSPNIMRVIKSRRLRWAGHVARMEEVRSVFKILTGKPTGKRSRKA